eukprot:162106-Prymnesium_polylepis.1
MAEPYTPRDLAWAINATLARCRNSMPLAERPPTPASVAAVAAAACVFRHSQSQHGEDFLLLPTLLQAAGGRPGIFVELGAFDGITFSNTVALERCFNWTGVLIEGSPSNFERLRQSGRQASMLHSAVCNGTGSVPFTVHRQGRVTGVEAADLSAGITGHALQRLRRKGERHRAAFPHTQCRCFVGAVVPHTVLSLLTPHAVTPLCGRLSAHRPPRPHDATTHAQAP